MAYANCNWWQYSKWVYGIGRTVNSRPYTEVERTAIIAFIEAIETSRPGLKQRLNLKKGFNGPLNMQNNLSLGKMVQLIGRQLKTLPPTEAEKTYCDDLFASAVSGRLTPVDEPEEVEEPETPDEDEIDTHVEINEIEDEIIQG